MIRTLRIERWRAYDHLELELGAGTTFVVARNGIGKSSLLEAARFAATGIVDNPANAIRIGAKDAEVEVLIELEDQTRVTVVRTLKISNRKPVISTRALVDGEEFDGDVDALLADRWRAPTQFVAKTAFIPESLQQHTQRLGVRDQLARAFGVDALRNALIELDGVLADLETRTKDADRDVRDATSEREQKVALLADLDSELKTARSRREELADVLKIAEKGERDARDSAIAASRRSRWIVDRRALAETVSNLAGEAVQESELRGRLEELEHRAEQEVEAMRQTVATTRARIETIQQAVVELENADAVCPVCRRPLDDDTRHTAEEGHRSELTTLAAQLEALDTGPVAGRATELRELAQRSAVLGAEPPEPPSAVAVTDVGTARQAWQAAVAEAAGVEARREQVAASLAALDAAAERIEEVKAQYRDLAVLSATRDAVDSTIKRVLTERVEPVLGSVRRRWKRLFPDRPDLELDIDGNFSRPVAGGTLRFEGFSGGERASAQLLLRLVLVDAATRVGFCWIDEPLEHLDPTSRRMVGGMLAQATAASAPRRTTLSLGQLFVTTYEEPLARRLARAIPGTRVIYVSPRPAG